MFERASISLPFRTAVGSQGMVAGGEESLEVVREGVHADRRGDAGGQADSQGRIGDDDPGQHQRMEDDPL